LAQQIHHGTGTGAHQIILVQQLSSFGPAFNQLKDLMRSLMNAIVKSGRSAGEAIQKIQ
jgi:hypothetical protein